MDDELEMRIFLSNVLKTGGFKPVDIESGSKGLQKALDIKPDLIILNAMMPKEKISHIYRSIKKDKYLKMIPIIMHSTLKKNLFYHYQKFRSSSSEKGMPEPEAYLEKPFEVGELINLVNMLVHSNRVAETLG